MAQTVYSFTYDTCCGDTLVDVFDSLEAVRVRLELMDMHNSFDEYETITIRCQELTDVNEMKDRLERVKQVHAKRDAF